LVERLQSLSGGLEGPGILEEEGAAHSSVGVGLHLPVLCLVEDFEVEHGGSALWPVLQHLQLVDDVPTEVMREMRVKVGAGEEVGEGEERRGAPEERGHLPLEPESCTLLEGLVEGHQG
jgi:hypothetical protein